MRAGWGALAAVLAFAGTAQAAALKILQGARRATVTLRASVGNGPATTATLQLH